VIIVAFTAATLVGAVPTIVTRSNRVGCANEIRSLLNSGKSQFFHLASGRCPRHSIPREAAHKNHRRCPYHPVWQWTQDPPLPRNGWSDGSCGPRQRSRRPCRLPSPATRPRWSACPPDVWHNNPARVPGCRISRRFLRPTSEMPK
jgi:hypothetical protein